MGKLLLLFIVLPAVELALLIEIGQRLGTAATLSLIVVTGLVGASLARREGLRVLSQVRSELDAGVVPGDALVDGLMILVAGALLVTPGILTDFTGFLCLIPAFRGFVKTQLRKRFEEAVASGQVRVEMHGLGMPPRGPGSGPRPRDPIIDVTPKQDR